MTRLLMCPPTHFGVTYDINPWMTRNVGVPTPDAARQWDGLVATLRAAGDVTIELVPARPGLPDLVFTANAALVTGATAVVSTFRYPERRGEEPVYRDALARAGLATASLDATSFEGAGDALFDRRERVLYLGYGRRTDRAAAERLAEIADVRVEPLELVDDRFYHLDTCFCPLGSGHALVFMDAFAHAARRAIREAVPAERLVELDVADAAAFACNAVEVGRTLVLHAASDALRGRLAAIGYRVLATDLSEFLKAGGSAKCLTLKLEDGPAVADA